MRSPTRQVQKAYALSTAWMELEPYDTMRRGVIVQNQSANTDTILVADGEPTSDFCAIELQPSGDFYEDILPMCGKIWAKAKTGAPTLTLVLKY